MEGDSIWVRLFGENVWGKFDQANCTIVVLVHQRHNSNMDQKVALLCSSLGLSSLPC